MLLADVVAAEPFLKVPNIVDVVSLVLAVGSIWYAWLLARRDFRKRLDEATGRASEAAREEVRRVAQAVLNAGVADVLRSLDLAREACRGRNWDRAGELCELAQDLLARVLAQPSVGADIRAELQVLSADVLDCTNRLWGQPRRGTGELPAEVQQRLNAAVSSLHAVHSRMTAIRPEAPDGP